MISDQQPSNTQTNTNSHTPLPLSLSLATELPRSLFTISTLSHTARPSLQRSAPLAPPTAFLTRISQ